MKSRIIDYGVAIAFITVLVSTGIYAYQRNTFHLKQAVVTSTREPLNTTDVNVEDKIDNSFIKDFVMKNDETGLSRQGIIAIPDLGILLPIYNKPYDDNALKVGAQQLKALQNQQETNATMGQGNLILVAHNYTDGKTVFSPLQQTSGQNYPYLIGRRTQDNHWLDNKKIYTANQNGFYEYTIDTQKTIPEYALDVRNDSVNSQINVITCLSPDSSFRIVTHGNKTNQWNYSNVPTQIANYFNLNKQKFNL